jgi:hypothetical protein
VELIHVGGPGALVSADPQAIAAGKRLGVGRHQHGDEIQVVVCLRAEVEKQSGECVYVAQLRGRIPSGGRTEYIGMPEDQE